MSPSPNFTKYLNRVVNTYDDAHPHLRWGQCYYNALVDFCPNLALIVNGDPELDPFYRDDNIPVFLEYVKNRWGIYD